MTKAYEELVGSIGRAVYFRPERKRVRELLSREAEPTLRVGERHFGLHDISLSGVSIIVKAAEADTFQLHAELDIAVLIRNDILYSGRARVARKQEGPGGTLIGVAVLGGGLLDLSAFLHRDEESQLEQDLRVGPTLMRGAVPAKYLEFVEKASTWVQFYHQSLKRHEERYRAKGMGAVEELVHRSTEILRAPWLELEHEGSELAAKLMVDPKALRAAK